MEERKWKEEVEIDSLMCSSLHLLFLFNFPYIFTLFHLFLFSVVLYYQLLQCSLGTIIFVN